MNQIATVSVVDKDGDVGVIFEDDTGFVFHPACLITVQKMDDGSDSESDDNEDIRNTDEGQIIASIRNSTFINL